MSEAALPALLVGLGLLSAAILFVSWRKRRRVEASLRFSEAKFAGMVAISTDAIISVDESQRITDFNSGAEQIFGYPASEVLGEPLSMLIPDRFRAAHAGHVASFAESPVAARRMGDRRDVDIRGVRRSGEEFPAEASISKLSIGGRRVYTVVLRDITLRRRREEGQRFLARAGALLAGSLDYQETLQTVADLAVAHLADLCVIFMLDDHGALRRAHAAHRDPDHAESIQRLLRFPPLEAPHPGRTAVDTGRLQLLSEVPETLLESLSEDGLGDLLRQLGAGSAVIAPLVARGATRGALEFVSAERGRYGEDDAALVEELARRAALALDNARLYSEAQQAISARNEVLSVVSHDLGNPLSAIFIGTRLLLRSVPESERGRGGWEHLESIRHSAEQMQTLIDDLLEVQRIESGKLSLEWDRYSAQALVSESVARISPLASDRSLSLVVELPPHLPPVRGDRDRILQVFGNLLGNAVKFTPEGGRIRIRAEREGSSFIRFSVADTGTGVPPDQLPHIFDRFWQARRTGKRGAGLGLAIARGIVEAHGGDIRAESEAGRGTVLSFTIPLASAAGE